MATAVELGDGHAGGGKGGAHMAIESAVRGVTVDRDHGQPRLTPRAVVLEVNLAPIAVQGGFDVRRWSLLHRA